MRRDKTQSAFSGFLRAMRKSSSPPLDDVDALEPRTASKSGERSEGPVKAGTLPLKEGRRA